MLSEINQTFKNILCFHCYEIPRIGKFTETEALEIERWEQRVTA